MHKQHLYDDDMVNNHMRKTSAVLLSTNIVICVGAMLVKLHYVASVLRKHEIFMGAL